MVGNELEVITVEGPVHRVPITIAVMCSWEDQHPGLLWTDWATKPTFKPLAYMGWAACRNSGIVVKPFPEWLPTITAVNILGKEQTAQAGIINS
jgi:hypothetical protein